MLSCQERHKKFWGLNRATGAEVATSLADIARAALAFAGFVDFSVPSKKSAAKAVYAAVVPEDLQYTDVQWKNNRYEAMASMLKNAPGDEKELSMVVHKLIPGTKLSGQKWRITLPAAYSGEPSWFATARVARAEVRAHALQNKDTIVQALKDAVDNNQNDDVALLDDAELLEYEPLPESTPPPPSDDDSGDAAKENAGAARGNKRAASKPEAAVQKVVTKKRAAPAAKVVTKKRARADDSSDDDMFQAEAPKAKRMAVKPKKEEDLFFSAVEAVSLHASARLPGVRKLIGRLGLLEDDAFHRRKTLGQFATSLAAATGGTGEALAEQLVNVLRDEAKRKLKDAEEADVAVATAEPADGTVPVAEPEAATA